MSDSSHDKLLKATIARGLETLDAAFGRPFDALPIPIRVNAFFPALRLLPPDAVEWAIETACSRLEKYPIPAQLRRLAQGSPSWTALLEHLNKAALAGNPPPPDLCADCGEARAFHRITVLDRPLVVRVIRHRSHCPHHDPAPWTDPPPKPGTLEVGEDAWRAVGIDWTPPREARQEPTPAEEAGL